MTEKIFRSVLLASVSAMFAVLIIITGILYGFFGEVQHKNLKSEYSLASAAVEQNGIEYLSSLKNENYRLTWVSQDGKVLFDTAADAPTMENHADREEIKEALNTGKGESERYSNTLTEKTLYYAGRLSDGSVLRISSSHASVISLVLGMLSPVFVVLIILSFISVIISRRMAKHIVNPLNSLDLENPLENKTYDELAPFLLRINNLQGNVKSQLKELKRKTDEFEQIIGSMNEGLVLLNKNGNVVSINNAAMKIFGVDKKCVGDDFLTVDRSIEMQNAISDALSIGHSEIRSERYGCEYQFDISRIKSDEVTAGIVILAFDVTEKVFAERNRREFTANVSHELKTPLQSITGSAELIEKGLVKPEDMPRFVGHIRVEAARLVTLIEDIIRLSQLDEDIEMQREDIDLLAVADNVTAELRYAAEMKEIFLTATGEPVIINGVKKLITEIIFNLCDNAIKYTDEGGKVEISIKQSGDSAAVSVVDNGIGISPEHQQRIFERFYRVDKSHSKASGGTGLGLSIVKHAVQYHHGSVAVNSKVGHGSEFVVTLPLK